MISPKLETARSTRDRIDESITAGDITEAYALLRRLWWEERDSGTAGFIVGRYQKIRDQLAHVRTRVAILRSFTVEPIVPLLRAGAAIAGIDVEVQLGEFNAYAQEILDPDSKLYGYEPMVIVLAVQSRDIVPELWNRLADLGPVEVDAAVERAVQTYADLVENLRERTKAHVIIHGLELPARAPMGVIQAQGIEPLARVNAGLKAVASRHTGVHVLDYDGLVARHGRLAWHDERKWLMMRMPIAADCLIHVAEEWLRYLHPITGKVCKALVCDLDDTLWGGVVGEDGLDGIALGMEYPGAAYTQLQRVMLDLYQRGIILAVCSKNNFDDAMEVIEKHPGMLLRPKHFAALRINWTDKSHNLRELAAELNIGIDALAFIDDNPAERALVRSQLPEVTVLEIGEDPMTYADTLRQAPVFERLVLSVEDRNRGRMYAEQRQRVELKSSSGSLEHYYTSLEMKADIKQVVPSTLARAAQLTQKTNQFNLTTKRYSEQQISAMAEDPCWSVHTIRVTDRFGDSGVVGLMISHAAAGTWEIDTFLLSCRVIGRTLETAMLATLAEEARKSGAGKLVGWFRPTKKNAPAKDFFAEHGFQCVHEEPDGS